MNKHLSVGFSFNPLPIYCKEKCRSFLLIVLVKVLQDNTLAAVNSRKLDSESLYEIDPVSELCLGPVPQWLYFLLISVDFGERG